MTADEEGYDEARSCKMKRSYKDRKTAKRVAKKINLKKRDKLKVYTCRYCPQYHIGHDNSL